MDTPNAMPALMEHSFRSGIGEAISNFSFSDIDWHSVWRWFPIAVAGIVVWALWLYRFILSRRAKPIVTSFRTSTSVVVPSFHEDVPILMRCLGTWLAQNPSEVIIVLDVADTEALQAIQQLNDPRVRPIMFRHAGKRSALGVGIRAARGELLVLTDSDTQWEPELLQNVQMPFADPQVGACSTQQNVYERNTSIWRRIADWLVNLRYYDYVPAMGRAGAVACVSGRTGVYRRSVVLPVLDNLENEFFLGRRCVSGDDGRLTWLVIASGYKTVHQSSAKALSMFPASFRAFVKQRVRWSRNSYRCYLTAVYKGWLWRVPFVTKVTVLQILLTPVTMAITLGYIAFSRIDGTMLSIGMTVGWVLLGRGIRGASHLRRHPLEIFLLPVTALVVIMVALPIKLYAFVTMNKQGWLTRHADRVGGDGQNAASLNRSAGAAPQRVKQVLPQPVSPVPVGPVEHAVPPHATGQRAVPQRPVPQRPAAQRPVPQRPLPVRPVQPRLAGHGPTPHRPAPATVAGQSQHGAQPRLPHQRDRAQHRAAERPGRPVADANSGAGDQTMRIAANRIPVLATAESASHAGPAAIAGPASSARNHPVQAARAPQAAAPKRIESGPQADDPDITRRVPIRLRGTSR
nr:glycosyltransferase [Nakamurella aerolata]